MISQLQAVLKEFYLGQIIEQLNTEALCFRFFMEAIVQTSGKQFIVPLHTGRNTSVMAAYEGEDLGEPGQQDYEAIHANWGYVYGQFKFTGPAMAAAANSRGAFGTMIDLEMEPLRENVQHYSDICAFVGGKYMGFAIDKVNGTTFQFAGRVGAASFPKHQLPIGSSIKFWRTDTWAQVGATVTLVNLTVQRPGVPPTIVVSAAIDLTGVPADVAVVVECGSARLGAEPVGLIGNLYGPTYYDMLRGTPGTEVLDTPYYYADPIGGVYSDPNPNTFTNLSALIRSASGTSPDFWFINPLQISAYSTLLQGVASGLPGSARMDVKTGAAKGDLGFTDYAWAGKGFEEAQDCPFGVAFFLKREHCKLAQLEAAKFDDTTGAVLRAVPGTDTYTGLYKHYYQTFVNRPNSCGAIIGMANPT